MRPHAPCPTSPLAAATHADPYPYYATLVAERPLHFDDAIGMWVAASAGAVTATLASPDCRVRPAAEPVPAALVGSAAGDLFGRLARMTDGADHAPRRHGVSATLGALDDGRVAAVADEWARRLVDDGLASYAFRLPVHVVGTLLGVAAERLPETAADVDALVAAFAPAASAERIARGSAAAVRLLAAVRAADARPVDDTALANRVGLLTQSYEATAGLIGNTIASHGRHLARCAGDGAVERLVREVARHDAPIQNTRRFVARDTAIAGVPVRAGDAILVLLAAANRDPAANADPHRFDPDRAAPRCFTFGGGAHRCPGERVAVAVAAAGVRRLAESGLLAPEGPPAFRPSTNARLALLGPVPGGAR